MSTDVVHDFRQAWARGASAVGVAIDADAVPDVPALRQAVSEWNTFLQAARADATVATVLMQVDALASQQFAYAVRQAGLFSSWPSLMDNWPSGVPVLTGWHNLVETAVGIYRAEIRPWASADDIALFQELDHIMAI